MEDIFTMRLDKEYFDLISSGKKTYEIRLNDAKRREIQVGNYITFISREDENKTCDCVVEQLLYFDSFVELFSSIRKEDCGFKNSLTADQIEDIFLKFYTAKELDEYGIVAIKIKKIKITK